MEGTSPRTLGQEEGKTEEIQRLAVRLRGGAPSAATTDWFWIMVHAYRELTISLMLARASNRTASVIIFDLWSNGSFQQLSPFGVVMFTILIALVSIAQ